MQFLNALSLYLDIGKMCRPAAEILHENGGQPVNPSVSEVTGVLCFPSEIRVYEGLVKGNQWLSP